MKNITEKLKELSYIEINDFKPKHFKVLSRFIHFDTLPTYARVYAKIYERIVEFTDNNDVPLFSSQITVASIIVLDHGQVIDKYIVQLKPFYIRESYEIQTLLDTITELHNETEQNFPIETEEPTYES